MKIGKKIFLSFTFICLFVIASALISVFYTLHISNKLSEIIEVANPAEKNIEEMVSLLWRSNYVIQRFSSETDPEALDSLEFELKHLNRLFIDRKKSVEESIDNTLIENKLSQAGKKQENFHKFALKLMDKQRLAVTQDTTQQLREGKEIFFVQYSILKQLEKDVVDAVDLLGEAAIELEALTETANEESYQAVKNAILITLLTTILSILSAGVIWSILTKSITKPISALAKATTKLSSGNFDIDVKVDEAKDNELSGLATTFNQMVSGLRTVMEESPRLKKFIKIRGGDDQKEQKYIVEKGTSYLIKDPSAQEAYDILLHQVSNKRTPLFVTRKNPDTIKERYGIEKDQVIWLTEEKEKGVTATADLKAVKKLIIDFVHKKEKPIVLLDRIDYLMNLYGFEEVFAFLVMINDKIMAQDAVFLLPIDASIFTNKQLSLLEKELSKPPQQSLTLKIPEELKRILAFVANRKSLNKPATYKDVGQQFKITAPTTQKKVQELTELGLIRVAKIGRNKVIEMTREGERVIANK